MTDFRRLLFGAAALIVTSGVGAAHGQTVIVRKAAPGASIEVSINNAPGASTKTDAGGDVVLPIKIFTGTGKLETDSQVLVGLCEAKVIRVILLERGHSVPAEERGCVRRDMGGWFVVKPTSTLVIDVGGPTPTLLLRQGSYSLAPPRTWSPSPTGFVLFGGGTFNGVSTFKDVACGTVADCSSGAELGFTAGAAYWVLPFVAAEASYVRPKEFTASGSAETFRFDSTLDAHLFTAVGKVGVPAGPVRPYGQVGATYHRATFSTSQTMTGQTDVPAQTYSLETAGWAWTFGGGLEVWFSRSFGIYGELNRSALKGPAVEANVEGILDDRMTTVAVGARIRIGG
jgi:Autotransporter beta-domain